MAAFAHAEFFINQPLKYCNWPESSTQNCILVLTWLCDFQVNVTRWCLNFMFYNLGLKSYLEFQVN